MIRRSNLPGLVAGTLVSTITTVLLFALPELLPIETIKLALFQLTGQWISGNPLSQFRIVGGLPGGIVAGALVRDVSGWRDLSTSAKYGIMSALLGLMMAYVFAVLLALAFGVSPPVLVLLPLFALMVPFYLLGGAVGAFVGLWLGGRFVTDDEATA